MTLLDFFLWTVDTGVDDGVTYKTFEDEVKVCTMHINSNSCLRMHFTICEVNAEMDRRTRNNEEASS
jgi:hypothetical protein